MNFMEDIREEVELFIENNYPHSVETKFKATHEIKRSNGTRQTIKEYEVHELSKKVAHSNLPFNEKLELCYMIESRLKL